MREYVLSTAGCAPHKRNKGRKEEEKEKERNLEVVYMHMLCVHMSQVELSQVQRLTLGIFLGIREG